MAPMSDLAGMTVNERLFHKGLPDEFERAVREADIPVLRRILTSMELDEQNVHAVIKSRLPFLSDAVIDQSPQA